jgi:magnesium transporter
MNVGDTTGLEQLRDFFDSHPYFAVPVTNSKHQLVGVVRRSDVEEALGEKSESDFRRSQGIVHEELRTMPLLTRSRRRLAWLSVNILLNVLAASVIAFYQETLAQVIALTVFIPIISDMSGCSGNQAVAVSMRELSLGLVDPGEVVRVWLQELAVGAVNGFVLGGLIAVVAIAWKGNAYLGLVVGGAMMINTLLAATLGGCIPLILKRMKVDPALASGPILTTVTDMCGFFLILSFSSALLPQLTH